MAAARPTYFQITPQKPLGLRVEAHWVKVPNDTSGPLVVLSLVRADDAKEIPARLTLTLKDGETTLWSGSVAPDPVDTRNVIDGSTGKIVPSDGKPLPPDMPKIFSFHLSPKLLGAADLQVACSSDGKETPLLGGMTYWFHLNDFLRSPPP